MRILTAIATLCLAISSTASLAQQPSVPTIELPKSLRPYSNIPDVLATASQVLMLMASAKVVLHPSSLRPTACSTDQILSIYRGMAITHASHKLFINRLEVGWLSTESLMSGHGDHAYRALLQPSRLALWIAWKPTDIARIMALADKLSAMPNPLKSDLKDFLRYLQNARGMYLKMRDRAPKQLAEIERVTDPLYSMRKGYARTMLPNDATEQVRNAFERDWPEMLFYDSESEAYRQLIDSVRDLGQDKLDRCLDGDQDDYRDPNNKKRWFVERVEFGIKSEIIAKVHSHYPLAYAIGFWRRRYDDATMLLADMAIERAIGALEAK